MEESDKPGRKAIPSRIGEHDLSKPACFKYCKMAKEYCPLAGSGMDGISIRRWTDVENGSSYRIDFSGKPSDQSREPEVAGHTCWCDGSGFEYDQISPNLTGPSGVCESVYDIYNYGVSHQPKMSDWNSWLDKFQYDYRYGMVSDLNAETVMFPNNDNPWMFTEYVFKGTGKFYDSLTNSIQTSKMAVIEPPIYDENTLELVNGDLLLYEDAAESENKGMTHTGSEKYDGKYADEESDSRGMVRRFRRIGNWDEWNADKEKRGNSDWTCEDAGARLYHVNVNVQCVKWGEHGNVPPHSIDMTAPEDWMDPTRTVSKVKPVYKAHIGTPLFAGSDGVVSWTSSIASIGPAELAGSEDADGRPFYSYDANAGKSGIEQDMPKDRNGRIRKPTTILMDTGEYAHGGCALLCGKGGRMTCKAMEGLDRGSEEFRYLCEKFKDVGGCMAFGKAGNGCSRYVASAEHPPIASYQGTASNMSDYYEMCGMKKSSSSVRDELKADAILNQSTGLPMADMMVALGFTTAGVTMTRPDAFTPDQTQIWYELTFENQFAPSEPMLLNKKIKNFGKGVQIVPETGKFAFDTRKNANPVPGDEVNSYGDADVLSFHRLYSSVMHCATQASCNQCVGMSQRQGFFPGERAGGDGKCRYYRNGMDSESMGREGCPYTCVPKRAYEFGMTMDYISKSLDSISRSYEHLTGLGLMSIESDLRMETRGMWRRVGLGSILNDTYYYRKDGDVVTMFIRNGVSSEWGGAELPVMRPPSDSSEAGTGIHGTEDFIYAVCKFKVSTSRSTVVSDAGDELEVDVDRVLGCYFWYRPLDDDGNEFSRSGECHVNDDHLWFCKTDVGFVRCLSNSVMIDNEEKFIGGYHPQYKDYGKMGQEFMQDIEPDYEREGNAMGDVGVGDSSYTGIPFPTNKKGYWVDASGTYIMDERSTGIEESIATDDERGSNSGHGTCISFKKSNTEIDGSTGKQKQPKVVNGAVFSNDPYDLVYTVFRKSRHKDESMRIVGRPMLQDPNGEEDSEYYAPCCVNNPEFLPTMRQAAYCPTCDYYISHKYFSAGRCPWCGSEFVDVPGDRGVGIEAGGSWGLNGDPTRVMTKFFKLNAIGQVQVWGPPGTCVHRDAYYWRRPVQISNGLKNQLSHRLGRPNSSGGCYSFDGMSPEAEMTLGYPEGIGKYVPIPSGGDLEGADARYSKKAGIAWRDGSNASEDGLYNGVSPRRYLPMLGMASKEAEASGRQAESPAAASEGTFGKAVSVTGDEGVIAPFTDSPSDALKMASLEQIRSLRNFIEPVMAYVYDPYSADYPTKRCSYNQRERQDQNIIHLGRRATVSPEVLASTGDGEDAFVQYYSGDLAFGAVREYYPPGYSWWFLKQVIGGRYSDMKGGEYHMDSTGGSSDMRAHWPTSGVTVAKCLIFIHGVLPLDKEIVKAYVIVSPSPVDASKNPIGRTWNGSPMLFHHYHSVKKDHYGDGRGNHLHGTAGYSGDGSKYFDEDGNFVNTKPGEITYSDSDSPIEYKDEGLYMDWGRLNSVRTDENPGWYEDNFMRQTEGLPAMKDIGFYHNAGIPKDDIMKDGKKVGEGYSSSSDALCRGWQVHNSDIGLKKDIKFQYVYLNESGGVVQQYPNSEIWRTRTKEEIDRQIGRYTYDVEFKASDGTEDGTESYVFTETRSELTGKIIPDASQPISGYFDMSWTNTTGKTTASYRTEDNLGIPWDSPVIFQGGEESPSDYSGSSAVTQRGRTDRVLDVTEIVKKLYNDRIDRSFSCMAGDPWETVRDYRANPDWPVLGGTLEKADDDVVRQNRMMVPAGENPFGGYLLTDCDSYPKTDGGMLPGQSGDGDKYELAPAKSVVYMDYLLPLVISRDNSRYRLFGLDGLLEQGRYDTDAEVMPLVESMFSGTGAKVRLVSPGCVEASSETLEFEFGEVADSCYGSLGIHPGTYPLKQDRIASVTSHVPGYHPLGLMGEGGRPWVYDSYSDRPQSFVVDLARAPLCTGQRDWRYKEGTTSYGGCRCPSDDCLAHDMTCSEAASAYHKQWSQNSPSCPWGHSLSGADGKVSEPGDGIMTYDYDPDFREDPYITGIEASPLKCSYRVGVRNSESSCWRTLIDVSYDRLSGVYTENFPSPGATYDSPLRKVSFGPDESMRARYLKVECESEFKEVVSSYLIESVSGYSVTILGDFSELGSSSLAGAKVIFRPLGSDAPDFGNASPEELYEVMSSCLADEGGASIRLGLNRKPEPQAASGVAVMSVGKSMGGMSEFRAYGFHYTDRPGKDGHFLTVTGFESEQAITLDFDVSSYPMAEPPTQILSVQVGPKSGSGIYLEQTDDMNGVLWETEEVTVMDSGQNPHVIRRIVGGKYYYEPRGSRVVIPREDSSGMGWEDFEKPLVGYSVGRTFLPSTMFIRYWSGNGKEFELHAEADGNGPSYQLEKDAIQFISSGEFPDNGVTCKMVDVNGNIVDKQSIEWTCYNRLPATLDMVRASNAIDMAGYVGRRRLSGEFGKPTFSGNELKGDLADRGEKFISLFGEHCEGLMGKCQTEMVFTGAPNRVVSGRISVTARAVTRKTIDCGDGRTVVVEEKTGGLNCGCFQVSLAPRCESGRCTPTYSIPRLLVYARESRPAREDGGAV